MTAEEHNKLMREIRSKRTSEQQAEIDQLISKAEKMGMFYLVGECPKEPDPPASGPKKD